MSFGGAEVVLTPNEVLHRGLLVVGFEAARQNSVRRKKNLSRFRRHYAADPAIYAILLVRLQTTEREKAKLTFDKVGKETTLNYFFMAINLLANYPKEESAEATFKISDRTWRKWAWQIVEKVSLLKPEIIVWPERWSNPDNQQDDAPETIFIITVDGVHCPIEEPTHNDFSENTIYYSHKFNSAALDYEIALSVYEDKCVWASGPYPAGKNDISVFRHRLKDKISESRQKSGVDHHAIGDKGYRGERELLSVPSSQDTPEVRAFKSRALSRHETFNARLKNFECLDETFRHRDLIKHQWCFDACTVIVQLQLENGSPLFRV